MWGVSPQQPEDAEIVSEGPKPPPPPPRVAELKPAPAGEAFSVFDGPVDDAKNAKRKPKEGAPRARQAPNGKGRGRAKPQTPPAAAGPAASSGPDPELLRRLKADAEARQLLELYESWQLSMVRGRYAEMMPAENLEQLMRLLKYNPELLQRMSSSLGQGLYENEVSMPWWAAFGAMFVADVFAKKKLLEKVELAYQEHLRQKEAASSSSSSAPAKAA